MPGVLETPVSLASIYLERGDEVSPFRPLFTGDVLFENDPTDPGTSGGVAIVQHPCALRSNGIDLKERLLVGAVKRMPGKFRSDWSRVAFATMPLPGLAIEGENWYIDFDDLDLLEATSVPKLSRVATLAAPGVNLLLQRWIHHNSRAIVDTPIIHEAIAAQIEEADCMAEWCEELSPTDAPQQAASEFHEWIREPAVAGEPALRQSMLDDPQQRGVLRRAMRGEIRVRRGN